MKHALLTNDDGIKRRGLSALVQVAEELFERVTVVAPDTEMSGVSHGITLTKPLRTREHTNGHHSVSGTPADCVITALGHTCADEPPDLVLSGINHGPNLGHDVFYSGTVAGAREGLIKGIPAIAFSLMGPRPFPFEEILPVVRQVLKNAMRVGIPPHTMLNVNIPVPQANESYSWAGVRGIRGLRITSLGDRTYSDEIIMRDDPRGGRYFWIGGAVPVMRPVVGTDCKAIIDGYVSITPLSLDVTKTEVMESLHAYGEEEA
jgi:5'-nucleotidase